MKIIISLSIYLLIALMVSAQTQQGIVKTRGRMVNGVLKPGVGLQGATVQVKNRSAVVSGANGKFSFPLRTNNYQLESVKKNGYLLVDQEACRSYQYSANPLFLVMETPEQKHADLLDAQRKIRRTLQQQLQQREDELEELKVQNKLTQEEYQKRLQQLYDDQQNNEKMIADMAKEYSQIDYDQLDELNRQISDAILNGELTKADSLLHTKGNMNTRVTELRKAQQAEAQREAEIARQQEELAASQKGTKKKLEDLAQDCKNYFDLYKMSNQHDSAAYYIELRAALDTINVDWQIDAGNYFSKQNQYQKAISYYERTLRIRVRLAKSIPHTNDAELSLVLDNMAMALNLVRDMNNLAIEYRNTQRYTESEELYKMTLKFYRTHPNNSLDVESYVAMTLNNLANLYSDTQRLEESEATYREALETYRHLAASNPQAYEPDVAMTLYNLAILYSNTQRFEESEAMYKEALKIYRRLAASNPQAYKPRVASTLGGMSFNELFLKKIVESEQLAREGLSIDSTKHWIASNLAAALLFQGKYAEAETIYRQYKDELKDSFLDDFKQFEEAGVIPEERKEDVEKIKQLLNE